MKKKSIIFSAPSGSGKSTLIHHLLEVFPEQLAFSVSACSRDKRANEVDGKDYHFIGLDRFKQLIQEDAFVEWEEVYRDNFYGTLRSELHKIWASGKIAIFDVDVAGALALKNKLEGVVVSCFVMVNDIEELQKRLLNRGTDDPLNIQKRIKKAEQELAYKDKFDCVIDNMDKMQAFLQAENMVRKVLTTQ